MGSGESIMAELPLPATIEAIYAKYAEAPQRFRAHLGASQIGGKCHRRLWFQFHWAVRPQFPGRILRLFETGTREEARVIDNLRSIGIEVYDRDPETGKQIHFEEYGGHYAGSLDGIARGFPEAPVTWHVLEIKTANANNFKKLQQYGVQATKPEHYAQMQQYMAWAKLTRAYYICVCKDTDEIYGERVEFDAECIPGITAKVYGILQARRPHGIDYPENSSECRFCDCRGVCRGTDAVEKTCRMCRHAEVDLETGGWKCAVFRKVLSESEQETACDAFQEIEYARN